MNSQELRWPAQGLQKNKPVRIPLGGERAHEASILPKELLAVDGGRDNFLQECNSR